MPTTQQILDREFNLIKDDLIKKHIELGMRSSGKWVNSVVVTSSVDSVKMTGEGYTTQLEFGRKAGRFPPIEAIRQWIIDKGIVNSIRGDISVSSLAFLIARKIAREGWKRKDHGGVELVSQVITDKRIQIIIDMVGAELALTLVSKIGDELKQIAV